MNGKKIGYVCNLYTSIILCTDVFLLKDLMGFSYQVAISS